MPKLSDREQNLVFALAVLAMVCALGVFIYLEREDMIAAGGKIAALEMQIKKLNGVLPERNALMARREFLLAATAGEGGRYYARDQIDPYRFSITVRKALLANGLKIQKYQTVEGKDGVVLEFSLAGNAADLARFLKTVSNSEKYWFIPYLSVDSAKGNGAISAVMRIHYETLDSSGS